MCYIFTELLCISNMISPFLNELLNSSVKETFRLVCSQFRPTSMSSSSEQNAYMLVRQKKKKRQVWRQVSIEWWVVSLSKPRSWRHRFVCWAYEDLRCYEAKSHNLKVYHVFWMIETPKCSSHFQLHKYYFVITMNHLFNLFDTVIILGSGNKRY